MLGAATERAWAAEGVIEINAASVQAAGGFPFTIATAGSYRLSSDLTVPANTIGLRITADRVSLDLAGFSITSTFVCSLVSCAEGTGSGIEALGGADETTVENGTVSGFGRDCVLLNHNARAERIRARNCGRNGISFGARSLAVGNQISFTGAAGIDFRSNPETSAFEGNAIQSSGLGVTAPAIDGGFAIGGNLCSDGSCSPAPNKLFYLTLTTAIGSSALTHCTAGFHMASLWELFDPSALDYDTTRGQTRADSGQGPPSGASSLGWVRTGYDAAANSAGGIGSNNCNAWTSGDAADDGVAVSLEENWTSAGTDIAPPWQFWQMACSIARRVWCVQD